MPGIIQRIDVKYEGRVQGVGFRITVVELAEGLEIVGRVCNASDGSVRLWAAGDQKMLHELLARIRNRFVRNIVHEIPTWTEIATPSETEFTVGRDLAC